jgi:hypothetical protein
MEHGLNKRSKEMMKRLSDGEQLTVQDVIGDKFEPQGVVLMKSEMKHTELIIEAGKEKYFESRILTVVGVAPTGDYITLFQNGPDMDYATINARDVKRYSPIKTVDGTIVPINMNEIQELSYIRLAKFNEHHNKEVADLLASEKYDDDEMYKALTTKYK